MSEGDKERAIVAEAVATAWRDAAYRSKLVADPVGTLAAAGLKLPAGVSLAVVEDTPAVKHFAVPEPGKYDKFREAFLGHLSRVLPLPEGQSLQLVQNTSHTRFIVIPLPPTGTGTLTDEELMAVAGGGSTTNVNANANVNGNVNTNGAVNVNGVSNANVGMQADAVGVGVVAVGVAVLT